MSDEINNGQNERFDDLFRNGLGNLKVDPSPKVWPRLNRKLLWRELVRFNFTNVPWYTWLFVGTAVVMVGTGLYLVASQEEFPTNVPAGKTASASVVLPTHNTLKTTAVSASKTAPALGSKQSPVVSRNSSVISHPLSTISHPSSTTSHPSSTTSHQSSTTSHPSSVISNPSSVISSPPVLLAQNSISRPAGEPIILMTGYSAPVFSVIEPYGYVKLKHVDNPKPAAGDEKPAVKTWKPKAESSVGIGLDIAPQVVFYKVPSNYFKYNYTFDLGVQYNIRRFYVQAAAGFTWSSDIGNFAVYYTRRDSIGYIYSVGSFAPDPQNPGEVIYNTNLETVYDSNNYVYDYNTQNTYYYLQFPLTVGFKVFKKPLWSLGFEAGGLYMLMVKREEPNPVFYIPDTKVMEIVRQDPMKKNNSFGIIAGARFEYEFSKGFFVVMEPTFNYYINQVQEPGSVHATQPYAIGLRAGLWYRIGINSDK